ncbi:MAG: DUF1778 domain-containing protein [Bacteroidota bacterium]|nr:DUF1778 domain-containing protein [Bacteroidota bacterium]
MKTTAIMQSRFELRLSKEDRLFFERASKISGHKTFSSFVISVVRERAKKIISDKEQILVSQKDKEIFFNAVLSNIEPSEKLKKASEKYLEFQ